jgi:2'-5' RNA ligase
MTNMLRNQIETEFAMLWNRFDSELRETGGRVDMNVSSQNPKLKIVLTTVSRVPAKLHHHIAEIQESFISRSCTSHYFYPLGDLHFTIRDCTAYINNPERPRKFVIDRLSDRLNQIFSRFKSFRVELKGLNVFPTTIYIQLFDANGILQTMREVIDRELGDDYINTALSRQQLLPDPILSFVNIIRFKAPVSSELLDIVGQLREVEIGEFEVTRIELVRTDKLLSEKNTNMCRDYILSP